MKEFIYNRDDDDAAQRYLRDGICPLCEHHFIKTELPDGTSQEHVKAQFILDLVNHYKDRHIEWLRRYRNGEGDYSKRPWIQGQRNEERKASEGAKRQIIRKATNVLIYLGINSDTFLQLSVIDEKTIGVARGKLDNITID